MGALMIERTTYAVGSGEPATTQARLLAAAPILAVSEELTKHVSDLARLAPTSDATTALTLYRDKLQARSSAA